MDATDGGAPDAAGAGNGRWEAHGVLAKLSWAVRTEPGDVRPHNEDWVGAHASTAPDDAWVRGPLFVVADGMGGHAAGEVASRVAVETMLASWTAGTPPPPQQALRAAARDANVAVYDAALEQGRRGMGTTMVALTLAGTEALVASIGDSRAYRVRDGEVTQLTVDHSKVGEMVRMRMLSADQAARHPMRSVLTRSLGHELAARVDLGRFETRRDDGFVLCSDGLWDVVGKADLAEVAGGIGAGKWPTPRDAVDELVARALGRDAPDNVTCAIVRVTSDRPIPAAAGRRPFLFRRGR